MTLPEVQLDTVRVTVVGTEACHYCEDAREALAELAREHPLLVSEVDVRSAEGAALLVRHRPGMLPLVLVDDAFFSSGRLPRNKLRRHLRQGGDR